MVSDEALKKLQEQIAAWPMTQRFVVQQLIRDYLRNREDLRAYEATRLASEEGGGVMERLTFEGNFCDIAQCDVIPGGSYCESGSCTQRKVWERLKAYEDTGLTPELVRETAELAIWVHDNGIEKIKEWIKADKEGRLVVLPCKVGDTVYFRTYDCNGTVDLGIQPHKVTAIVGYAIVRGKYTDVGLLPAQYGVSWFLTREEAEAALEAKKNE